MFNGESLPHIRSIRSLLKRAERYWRNQERFEESDRRKEQREAAKQFALKHSFRDTIRYETVHRTPNPEITAFLTDTFGFADQTTFDFDMGEVFIDSVGTGTIQQFNLTHYVARYFPMSGTGDHLNGYR